MFTHLVIQSDSTMERRYYLSTVDTRPRLPTRDINLGVYFNRPNHLGYSGKSSFTQLPLMHGKLSLTEELISFTLALTVTEHNNDTTRVPHQVTVLLVGQ